MAATEMNIGNVLQQQGDHENALLRYQKALKIQEVALGPFHVAVAATKLNIALVYKRLGDLARARSFQSEAHSIYERNLGPDHPKTQNAARGLGLLQLGDDTVRAVSWFSAGAHQLLADLRLLPPP